MSERPPHDQHPAASEPPGGSTEGVHDDTEFAERTRAVQTPPPNPAQAPVPSRPRSRPPQSAPGGRPRPSAASYPPPAPQPYTAGPPPRRAPSKRATPPRESGLYLPWWSLVLMIGIVALAAFGVLYAASELSQAQTPGNQTPRVRVVTSQPTLSQDFAPAGVSGQGAGATAIPQTMPTPTIQLPTPIPSPSLPPGDFGIGTEVEVTGVETSGLNIRAEPGLEGTPRFLAYDGDRFVVVDGPQSVNGLEWWRIEDPDNDNRFGWAARNYLAAATS
ncbi:MAG: hypothetical protein GXY36_17680 [Chloroflexi bacterium]|nr:hypothetical protein [Chloroflexota bacterium]